MFRREAAAKDSGSSLGLGHIFFLGGVSAVTAQLRWWCGEQDPLGAYGSASLCGKVSHTE